MSCGMDSIPFKFLGLSISSNLRKSLTWNLVIKDLKKLSASWKWRQLLIGIKLWCKLSSIQLYFLSFYKAPRKVIQDIIIIQWSFLWGGSEDSKRICWVSWNNVCRPKEEEDSEVKKLIRVIPHGNIEKMKWRILNEHIAIWASVLSHKYDRLTHKILNEHKAMYVTKDSLW